MHDADQEICTNVASGRLYLTVCCQTCGILAIRPHVMASLCMCMLLVGAADVLCFPALKSPAVR